MNLDNLLYPRQSQCVVCPDPPKCNCAANEECNFVNRSCNACSSFKCIPRSSRPNSGGSGGVSKGALAGGIIGALILVSVAVFFFLRYRRKSKKTTDNVEAKAEVPAPADLVLNRPNPNEKSPGTELSTVRVYTNSSNSTIDLDPRAQASGLLDSTHGTYHTTRSLPVNPFDDGNSIQTVGTEYRGTNVIPIALVTPESESAISEDSRNSVPSSPARPARSPDLNLNLEHVNVSQPSFKPYPQSQISGISNRNSYTSNMSYASDFLNEAPMIITPGKGAVRQFLGVVKAEVVRTPGSAPGSLPPSPLGSESSRSTKISRAASSPLAGTSFGPSDTIRENDEGQEVSIPRNPFESSPKPSPSPSATTFGANNGSNSPLLAPSLPWNKADSSRPSSVGTEVSSIADIGTASRVNVGLNGPITASSVRSPLGSTIARLVSPPSNGQSGILEEQQQHAVALALARAQAQGLSRRASGSSAISSASTRADSILESFPFVPPSPISNRPMRSPPVSPLSKNAFNEGSALKASPPPSPVPPPADPPAIQTRPQPSSSAPAPPKQTSRRTLGLSTGSQLSTVSTGLGSYSFQIDNGSVPELPTQAPPPSSIAGRQRASLDTLALTSDLLSYPLGFDQDAAFPPEFHKR